MKATRSRVFITGLGIVSSAGHGINEFWKGCKAGSTQVTAIPDQWSSYYESTSKVWAPLSDPQFARYGLSKTDMLLLAKPSLLAVAAAAEAIEHSGLLVSVLDNRYPRAQMDSVDPQKFGIFVGTGLGGAQAPFNNHLAHILSGHRQTLRDIVAEDPDDLLARELVAALDKHPRVNPLVICQTMPNAIAANLAIRFGIRGPVITVCAACASGTMAIGQAFNAIRNGELDIALAGGAEHLSDRTGAVFMGFDRLQTLAKSNRELGSESRPFDRDRSGFLFSEGGAAVTILESEESANRRARAPIAEVVGYAATTDAYSIAAIRKDHNAIDTMLDRAFEDADISAAEIDYVNAHGTGTELNDAIEAEVIERRFRGDVKVNSTKSILGHTIGAAGAIEFVVTALSLLNQELHLSKNLENPIVDLDFCLKSGPAQITYAFSENFGFGGHNAGIVLRRV